MGWHPTPKIGSYRAEQLRPPPHVRFHCALHGMSIHVCFRCIIILLSIKGVYLAVPSVWGGIRLPKSVLFLNDTVGLELFSASIDDSIVIAWMSVSGV